MTVQLDAQITPIVVVCGGRVGLTLWAPPWRDAEGTAWEALLGATGDTRVTVFDSAAAMKQFIDRGQAEAFAGHPAWPGIQRRDAAQLRASHASVVDLDEVYRLAQRAPTVETLSKLQRCVRFTLAIADACHDQALAEVLERPGYDTVFEDISDFGGRDGARRWDAAVAEIATSWSWVLGRVDAHTDWRGNFSSVDAEALFALEWQAPAWPMRPPPAGYATTPDTGYSTLAIIAFVLAFVTGFGLPSIICGHLALGDIRRTGKRGWGLAFAGLVLGYLELAFILAFVLAGVLLMPR